jgi:hypothetical protein
MLNGSRPFLQRPAETRVSMPKVAQRDYTKTDSIAAE